MRERRRDRAKSFRRGDPALGKRIRTIRLQRGLSQMQLADEVGVTYQQIQKYEKGTDRITVDRLRKIARALEVSPATLLESPPETSREIPPPYPEPSLSEDEIRLIQAFRMIGDPTFRQQVLSLVLLGARLLPSKDPHAP